MTTYYIKTSTDIPGQPNWSNDGDRFYKIIVTDCNIVFYRAHDNTPNKLYTDYKKDAKFPPEDHFILKLENGAFYTPQRDRNYPLLGRYYTSNIHLDFSILKDNIKIIPYYKKLIIDKIIKHSYCVDEQGRANYLYEYDCPTNPSPFYYLLESLVELKQHNKHYTLLFQEKEQFRLKTIELNTKCNDMEEQIELMSENSLIDENTKLINENNELFDEVDKLKVIIKVKLEELRNIFTKYKNETENLRNKEVNMTNEIKQLKDKIDRLESDIISKDMLIKKFSGQLNDTQSLYNKLKNIAHEITKDNKCKESLILLHNDYKTKDLLTHTQTDMIKYIASIYQL